MNHVSIWPKAIVAPNEVRNPIQILEDAANDLNERHLSLTAEVVERRGENTSAGNPQKRAELTLRSPGKARSVATVEYREDQPYPATLIVGESDYVFLSANSEEELVEQLTEYLAASLR